MGLFGYYGFITIFLIAAHHRVPSAFSYNSRFTKCHRLLVNPGRLLKKIMRSTKQGNSVLIEIIYVTAIMSALL